MARSRRFFLYSQHLGGTGHFVRTYEIAQALAEHHEVYLVDGGRPVPRAMSAANVTLVPLPKICRGDHGITPFQSDCPIEDVMCQRQSNLLRAIEQIRPHVLMIEHFPFRRWDLHSEIVPAIQRVRSIDKRAKVVCSLRDITGKSRFASRGEQRRRDVLETLHEHFDALLVHADRRIVGLDKQLPWTHEIQVPIEYTGYVSQRVNGPERPVIGAPVGESRHEAPVIVSVGGAGCTTLLSRTIDAWNRLVAQEAVGDRMLLVFLPLSVHPEELASLERQARNHPICLLPFALDFLGWMQTAAVSISHAGYNTCTNILETRTRSILVPDPQMSDQSLRAALLAERGLAQRIELDDLTPDRLARAILDQLNAPAPQHDINLDGAQRTHAILESLLWRDTTATSRVTVPAAA